MIKLKQNIRLVFLSVIAILLIAITFLLPPISQPAEYHHFADQQVIFGIPNAKDVLSNIPLLLISMYGILFITRQRLKQTSKEEKNLWILFFGATAFSALLSGYYHLQPDNDRLAIERIGLSVLFMSFFSLMLIERLGKKIGTILSPVLLLLGIASVIYWNATEIRGASDLRLYALVQFGPLLLLLPLFYLFPSTHHGKKFLYLSILSYVVAKICEVWDTSIFQFLNEQLSGHTLKHLFASLSTLLLIFYLRCRKE